MLPLGAGRPAEDICGPWLELELEGAALLAIIAAQTQPRAGADRDSNQGGAEGRGVAMPTDRRPGRVARDEGLRKLPRREAGETGRQASSSASSPELRKSGG